MNAQDTISKLGGIRQTARRMNLAPGTVQGWWRRNNIPEKYNNKINSLLNNNNDINEKISSPIVPKVNAVNTVITHHHVSPNGDNGDTDRLVGNADEINHAVKDDTHSKNNKMSDDIIAQYQQPVTQVSNTLSIIKYIGLVLTIIIIVVTLLITSPLWQPLATITINQAIKPLGFTIPFADTTLTHNVDERNSMVAQYTQLKHQYSNIALQTNQLRQHYKQLNDTISTMLTLQSETPGSSAIVPIDEAAINAIMHNNITQLEQYVADNARNIASINQHIQQNVNAHDTNQLQRIKNSFDGIAADMLKVRELIITIQKHLSEHDIALQHNGNAIKDITNNEQLLTLASSFSNIIPYISLQYYILNGANSQQLQIFNIKALNDLWPKNHLAHALDDIQYYYDIKVADNYDADHSNDTTILQRLSQLVQVKQVSRNAYSTNAPHNYNLTLLLYEQSFDILIAELDKLDEYHDIKEQVRLQQLLNVRMREYFNNVLPKKSD